METQPANVSANPAATTDQVAVEQAPRSTSASDSQLLAQIGQRDEQALASLYDRYSPLVYSIVLRITHERAHAETIVQRVFHTVWQAAVSVPTDVNVPVWLSGMARQQALAAHHGRARATTHQKTHAIGRDAPDLAGPQALKVRRAFNRLSAEQRETIELAYYGGLSCREIALRLHEPVGTVMARLRDGLSTFCEQLRNTPENLDEPNL
ncbi:MAG TPA: sigma-70 family RNA polymerase sigma factor [Roseiflexaceae bacterium]|nr:sigma-70 family RNA polymerase sigma factor [Roseiflexaceae bacterium]